MYEFNVDDILGGSELKERIENEIIYLKGKYDAYDCSEEFDINNIAYIEVETQIKMLLKLLRKTNSERVKLVAKDFDMLKEEEKGNDKNN